MNLESVLMKQMIEKQLEETAKTSRKLGLWHHSSTRKQVAELKPVEIYLSFTHQIEKGRMENANKMKSSNYKEQQS